MMAELLIDYLQPKLAMFNTQSPALVKAFRWRILREVQGRDVLLYSFQPVVEAMLAFDVCMLVVGELGVLANATGTVIGIYQSTVQAYIRRTATYFLKYPDLDELENKSGLEEEVILDLEKIWAETNDEDYINKLEKTLEVAVKNWLVAKKTVLVGVVPLEMMLACQYLSYRLTKELYWQQTVENISSRVRIY